MWFLVGLRWFLFYYHICCQNIFLFRFSTDFFIKLISWFLVRKFQFYYLLWGKNYICLNTKTMLWKFAGSPFKTFWSASLKITLTFGMWQSSRIVLHARVFCFLFKFAWSGLSLSLSIFIYIRCTRNHTPVLILRTTSTKQLINQRENKKSFTI